MSHNYKNTIHGLKKINKTKESKRFEEKCGGGRGRVVLMTKIGDGDGRFQIDI